MRAEDFAQQLELAEYEYTQRRAIAPDAPPSLSHCEDCGCEIPLARQRAIRGVTRCIACQQIHELTTKRGSR
ncbi:TraR/DksA C4-type zinc finger protein [Nitrosomonas halophila]|uniref:Phage/conjugal plasmid C-4 type zinc finger protein, TraR family n=1 Tax=Nitrosomonas halophila TaxID=44576 RepID=A0A1H3FD32_9PROT|nr:TraR/DksA C4-type zinc finger protein [Nitrosomonas halophila]SDX88886.1 phage/conjugal plasmid C-4 type zinc finger protein, TraR family [Nitrosomonas halophila]